MINYNLILNRKNIEDKIKQDLQNFEENKNDNNKYKRGFYIYGDTGIGKTVFIKNLLKELNYDTIIYNAADMRNKSIIDDISNNNISNTNIISMFHKKKQKIAIIMDEIDGMNSGDKGGINSLITLIRNKKTKRQKTESISPNPIFCISTKEIDKKIGELMKVCNTYEIFNPTDQQINEIITKRMPNLNNFQNVVDLVQNDLRKLEFIYNIYQKTPHLLDSSYFNKYISNKSIVENSKTIVKSLYNNNYSFKDNSNIMNENDRTIVGLLWHENIGDIIQNNKNIDKTLVFYNNVLKNICFSDYIDRLIFQKQIWQLNELSSYIKIFYNNYLLHNLFTEKKNQINEIRFTKVLTKYSTEFNNYTFFQNLSYKLQFDKKDIITLFNNCKNNKVLENKIIQDYELNDLEVNRIYRYIDNYI